MNDRINKFDEPVCKFGPGGDFVSYWPTGSLPLPQSTTNRMTKILVRLNEIMGGLISSQLEQSTCQKIQQKGTLGYADKNNNFNAIGNTQAATTVKGNFDIYNQPLLFADDCRISRSASNKSKHRVRTRR